MALLRSSAAASGEAMNAIKARAASLSFETVSTAAPERPYSIRSGDAVAGAGEFHHRAVDHLPALDEIVEAREKLRDDVSGRIVVDILHECGALPEIDDDLVSARLLEPGREITHPGDRALIGVNDE